MRSDFRPQPAGAGAAGGTTAAPAPARRAAALRAIRRPRPELVALLVLAAVLDLWALGQNGWANDYYSAAVRSMAGSWHAFLFGSFDPSGIMTVDKPPLSLWVQALSVRVFGFHSLSILVPQALMGVASVGLTYDLVRRPFGRAAGFVAGLTLALTPSRWRSSATTTPTRCSCSAASARCGRRCGRSRPAGSAGSSSPGSASGSASRPRWPRRCSSCPAIVAAWLWVAPRGRSRR